MSDADADAVGVLLGALEDGDRVVAEGAALGFGADRGDAGEPPVGGTWPPAPDGDLPP